MEVKVFTLPGGQLQIFVDGDGVSYEDARAATDAVLARLRANGLDVQQTSEVEMHKTGGMSHVHVTGGTHVHHHH
jgi:hypothetical protein